MKNQSSSTYMRIRHYVFDWLARTKGSVTRIPSNRELAEKFEVSQPTVVRALQELIKEGYLVNRPGVGLFSNPERLDARESRIWGIVFGDGRWAYLPRDAFHVASCIGEELLQRDNHNLLKMITMGEAQQENFPELSMLSGICWWGVEERLIPDMLRISETVPVVVISNNVPGLDSFYFDFEAENYQTARWMIERGCRRLALVRSHHIPEAIVGIERACKEAGLEFSPGCVLSNDLAAEQQLGELIARSSAPDGIIFNCKAIGFPEAIGKYPELANCLISTSRLWVDAKWKFNGLVNNTRFEEVVSDIVDLLEMNVADMPRTARRLPVTHHPVTREPIKRHSITHDRVALYPATTREP